MALTVKLIHKSNIARREDGSRHGSIEWFVKSDDINQDIDAIADDAALPDQHVTAHPDNSALICRTINTERHDGSKYSYIVTAEYDSKIDGESADYNQSEAIVEGGLRGYAEPVPAYVDGLNQPVVNSAGDWFEGATRKKRMIAVPVTAYFNAIPWLLFTELANTVNSSAVTIHGVTFPAGTCALGDPNMPKQPTGADNDIWQVDYEILIDLDGWTVDYPNRGYQFVQYQTRAESDPVEDPRVFLDWEDVDYATYAAESDALQKRFLKRRTTDDTDADTPEQVWLDNWGQQVTASLDYVSGTCTVTAGSTAATSASFSPVLDPDIDVGKRIEITGAGLNGRKLITQIAAIASGGLSFTLASPAVTDGTAKAARIGGVWTKRFLFEDLADWSSLPLPNNQ